MSIDIHSRSIEMQHHEKQEPKSSPFFYIALPGGLACLLLLGLPILGAALADLPLARFTEFPPLARYVEHAPFAWPAFAVLAVWILAWTRFSWFAPFQRHTFAPLWFAYIAVVNGLLKARTGLCPLTDQSGYLAGLFVASAGFWNFYSLAQWKYCVPYVDGFRVFEMPLLGFAGYLPFGLECAVIADAVAGLLAGNQNKCL